MSSPQKKMKYGQNKAKYYGKPNREQFLAPGMRGFLATCNFREKDCIREAYNLLNHYADEEEEEDAQELGVEATIEGTVEAATDDIADQLDKEVDAAKTNQKKVGQHRFKSVSTGANNCIFIRTTLTNPKKLTARIFDDIRLSGEQKTRFLLRLLPIEVVCRIIDINSAAGALFDKYFLKEESTFAIVFNRRLNNDVKRDKIIEELAELVHSKNVNNRVDLKNPQKTVIVEIIKGKCLLSVVEGYFENKKFNLVELAQLKKGEGKADSMEESEGTNEAEKPQSSDESEEKQSNGEPKETHDSEDVKDDM